MNASSPTPYLLDTNFLLRHVEKTSIHHAITLVALDKLSRDGAQLCLAPQCLYEFWVVATRPVKVNGFGFTPAQTGALLSALQSSFILRPDTVTIFSEWERLVTTYAVQGKPSHDARLVAFMLTHGITHLLTFNGADFHRYASEGITIIDPTSVATPASS